MYSRLITYILASMLMGLHFYRAREMELIVMSLLIPLLLLVRKRWMLIALQALAYIGALEWVRTIFHYIRIRTELGMPWARLSLILGIVALFTAFAGFLLNSEKIKEKYPVK